MKTVLITLLAAAVSVQASERKFAYTTEPETMPAGSTEFEQWVTWRAHRSDDVGQHNYNRFDLREELEYGVTDNYTIAFYLNTKAENYQDPATKVTSSEFSFEGFTLEHKYLVLNPAQNPVGFTLYLETQYSGEEAEVEQKLIFGQRHGDWKWAINLIHATEWNLNDHETESEVAVTAGLTRDLNENWSLGLEARNHNNIPEYEDWENTACFIGPSVTYAREDWYATLSILPQVWGRGTSGGPDADGIGGLELESHERVNVRLVIGIDL